ncbi:MAG TPA: hypothetical protein VMU72_10815 [Gaiellaceae bacterium]|nr:hypothetical protein [Gaiellaceae bacterium]
MTTTKKILSVAALAAGLLLPATASADPTVLTPPAIPGVAQLPGPIAPVATPAQNMGILHATPDIGLPGLPYTLSGSGLEPNKDVSIVWMTANVTWVVDPRPDSVDYLGRSASKFGVVIANTTTDANGAFSLDLVAPQDFGGIHDIYAVVDGVQVSKGGFLIARSAKMTPKKGPVGTMITLTYSGLGSSLYEGGASLQYDNHYVGALTANWTRGVAKVKFRASGGVGKHIITVTDAISFDYLNIQQSPIPWGTGHKFAFRVTKDRHVPPAPQIDWPSHVVPTLDAPTTMIPDVVDPNSTASAQLSSTTGPVLSSVGVTASGLEPSTPVDLVWSTVVGSRVNCTSTCWSFVSVPLATVPSGADGSLNTNVSVPDGLGGWHVVQLMQGGNVMAQVPYFVKRSIVGRGVSALRLKAGQDFTIHLKGLGWTQLDNTIAVDYDNSYIGYGCGFNSNGDVVMNFVATGRPGTHLIDMYPLLYTQQPSFPNTPYGMVPMLTYARDVPGLALGYRLPAIRLAIEIVK